MKNAKEDNDIIKKQRIVRQKLVDRYIEYRKIRNLTQEELASSMGIKRPNISRFETGQYNPTLDLLVKMADCMELELHVELIDKREENGNE
ncbi:helix-turn-helix transcriptional regulator [Lachnospiraceae bacterium 42-17]|jgi:transcriptional regulator with XRE-family HTH domain|nr:helix-turn-helix transcriptional regulator [Dorea sp.]